MFFILYFTKRSHVRHGVRNITGHIVESKIEWNVHALNMNNGTRLLIKLCKKWALIRIQTRWREKLGNIY
jgi:hypothetical protein